ncbi:CsbD family protein [Acidiphilium multivorum]|uniref:CsbD family protein n=1 Tax=Acidiphilium multivorum TaxID=62140 RepID=UPI002016A175|nr:CsbD family protein [Acidiphilium multivorum]MBS3024578.1 CsbD family protein [Acidiphilium multivorum]
MPKEENPMDKDEIEGGARAFAGKAEEALGEATGDEDLQREGMRHQAAGEAQKLFGAAKDAARSASHTAGAAFESVRDSVAGGAGRAPEDRAAAPASDGAAWMADFVREQPVLALFGAATLGYALAFLFHGGRR